MIIVQRRTIWKSCFALAILACFLAIIWRHFSQSEKIFFLAKHGAADWILFPKAPDSKLHKAMSLSAEFRRNFVLKNVPAQATLSLRAFQQHSVRVNGQPL